MALQPKAVDHFGCSGGVVGFDNLSAWKLLKELPALHQGYGMGVDLRNIGFGIVGKAEQAMFDVELVFTDDGQLAIAQQFVVVKQTAGNGIFDGQDGQQTRVLLHGIEEFLKGVAAKQFEFFALEEFVGGYVVERTLDSLYGYFSHC